MNKPAAAITSVNIGHQTVHLYVPDPASVKDDYHQSSADLPYWSQIWPAAFGLCMFLDTHSHLIRNKNVLELAAGLGLPSLLAAKHCSSVIMSDYLPEAVEMMRSSIAYNQLEHASARLLDWNNLPSLVTDILLLSDINYEPAVFETVFNVISDFLEKGSTIILSTPQRLMAKPFIERLLVFCRQQEEIYVSRNDQITSITVLVLSKKDLN